MSLKTAAKGTKEILKCEKKSELKLIGHRKSDLQVKINLRLKFFHLG